MSDFRERVGAEASRLAKQRQDIEESMRDAAALRPQEELAKVQDEELRVRNLADFLEQLRVRSLLEQVNRESWDNVGTIINFQDLDGSDGTMMLGLALVSPVYRANILHTGWRSPPGIEDVVYEEFYTQENVVEFMSVTVHGNRYDKDTETAPDVNCIDRSLVLYKAFEGRKEESPEERVISASSYRDWSMRQRDSLEKTRARLEAFAIYNCASRKINGKLPQDLIAHSLPQPEQSSLPRSKSWFFRAIKGIRG